MGLAIKLFAGRLSRREGPEGAWLEAWAMIDIGSLRQGSKLKQLYEGSEGEPAYIYGIDGSAAHVEDEYKKRIRALPVSDVLDALRGDTLRDDWNRLPVAADLLCKMVLKSATPVYVVLYGY